ncbi:MAG TPA: tetratricopeptide repeat protein, partial [Gemmataceae bacterium]|nr:tetratricopeptide repeat protein [Gemmataceae bacterium]
MNEGFPRPQEWNQLLMEKVPANDLLNLDTIDLGFIRPRSPMEWQMAYCQSQLYVEYMKLKYGDQAVGAMLAAYRDGRDTAAAISQVCQVDKDTFEKGYREHVQEVVKTLHGKPAEKPLALPDLQEAHEKDPDDPEVSAKLAEQYLLRRRNSEARKLVETVLAKKKNHPLASYVKARLMQAAGDDEAARAILEGALGTESPEPKVLMTLGRIFYEAKEFGKAAEIFELARKSEPYESKWLGELVRIYSQTGDKEKQMAILKDLVPTNADDIDSRKQLARMLLEAGRLAEAERYARQSLEIDVLDAEAQKTLGDALLGQKKPEPAIDAYLVVLEINDKADDARLKLARAYLDSGSKEKARAEIEKVLARDPKNEEGKRLRMELEK